MDPIAPPHAYTQLLVEGVIRRCTDDFFVDEHPAFEASGEGEHLLLRIEKRGLNTHDVATELTHAFAVEPVDVSYAGMKDRHAVTRQWFSIRTPRNATHIGVGSSSWRVLEYTRHIRKLRRGDLSGNAFRIRVRDLMGDTEGLEQRLTQLGERGAPNYFGEQRFGHGGANVERARAWICRRPRPAIAAFQKSLHLSTARALLFNAVLAQRVVDQSWDGLIDGDVAIDESPTGPLWGRGRPAASGAALSIETGALEAYHEWLDPLEHLGLTQERRRFALRPRQLEWSMEAGLLELSFDLAPGQFATVLLRELGTLCNVAAVAS